MAFNFPTKEVIMEEDTKFRLVQNKVSKTLTLEYWTKYGNNPDDWISVDRIEDMSIGDLKKLRDYINKVCNKNLL